MAASGTPHTHKRGSLHRLSHTILSLASPPFSRVSFDAQGFGSRKKSPIKTSPTGGLPATSILASTRERSSYYTPSIASAVESQLSHSPLLPPTPHWPAIDVVAPVPPTTNELSEEEKMKLMKKVRKLSKVLGEVPVPAADEEQLMPPADDDSPKMLSAAAKKAFRRSLTFGHSTNVALLDAQEVQRAKSVGALRPSLHVPRRCPSEDTLNTLATPGSPILFARPKGARSSHDVSETASVSEARDLRRRDSTASSVLLADQNVEQVQRTRVAKLSRHFGTSIPPEVLHRATSPPPSSSSALLPSPTAVLSSAQLPRRSSSLRRVRRRRPASLDIRPIPGIAPLPHSPPGSPSEQTKPGGSLKRSRSLWAKRPKEYEDAMVKDEDKSEPELTLPRPVSLSEKQRVLNVKRARKMAQLFGDNPPSALFQVTNFAPGFAEDGDGTGHHNSDGHRYERDSLATIISISTTSLSPMLSATGKSKLRDSFLTTSSEISGLVLTGDEDEPEEKKRSVSQESEDITNQAQSSTVSILSPLPVTPGKGVHSKTNPMLSTSSRSLQSNRTLSTPQSTGSHLPETRPTPPPFTNLVSTPAMRPATAPPSSPAPSEFQTRRRRAAKLSKFFGVKVNELAGALSADSPPEASTRKTSIALEGPRERSLSGGLGHHTSVVVAEARRRRFLGLGDEDIEERDLSEVIDQLRKLRS